LPAESPRESSGIRAGVAILVIRTRYFMSSVIADPLIHRSTDGQ
jgi:hypothetical protein